MTTIGGQYLCTRNKDVGYTVLSFLVNFDIRSGIDGFHEVILEQERQLTELSDRIDSVNDQIIPSFLQWESVLSEPIPDIGNSMDTPATGRVQVYLILNDCHRHFECLPGLDTWIRQRYHL